MAYKIYLINLITTLIISAAISFGTEIGDYIESHNFFLIFLGFLCLTGVFFISVRKLLTLSLFAKSRAGLEFTTLKINETMTNTYDNDWVDLN